MVILDLELVLGLDLFEEKDIPHLWLHKFPPLLLWSFSHLFSKYTSQSNDTAGKLRWMVMSAVGHQAMFQLYPNLCTKHTKLVYSSHPAAKRQQYEHLLRSVLWPRTLSTRWWSEPLILVTVFSLFSKKVKQGKWMFLLQGGVWVYNATVYWTVCMMTKSSCNWWQNNEQAGISQLSL